MPRAISHPAFRAWRFPGVTAATLLCMFLATTAHAQLCGDADGDARVGVTDGVQALRSSAGLSTTCDEAECDVDGSGSVTVSDGVAILRRAAGLPADLPCSITPSHLAHGFHRFPSANLDDIDLPFLLEVDPGNTQAVYWAQQVYFVNGTGDDGAYLGLQTRGFTAGQGEVGRMAIFSVWNAFDAIAGPGATAARFSGEGTGYSVHLPYEFREGHPYRFRLHGSADGWWEVTLRDMSDDTEALLGRILGDPQWGGLQADTISFTEVYLPIASCAALAHSRMRFDPPTVHDGALQAGLAGVDTSGPCAPFARTIAVESALVHEIGAQ